MRPLGILSDLFLLRTGVYRSALHNPRAYLWASSFLLATGLLYGLAVAYFQRALGRDIKGIPVEQIPDWILYTGNLISGVLIVLIFHGGATLIVWLMARAVGGPGRLGELYRVTAYVLPLSWPGLPWLALNSAAQDMGVSNFPYKEIYGTMALLAFILACIGLYQLFRETQDIESGRAIGGVCLVALFCYSVLALISG